MPATPATAKQLSYLKALADRTGQTFTYPTTAAQASREIQRLKRTRCDSSADRRRERKEIADAIHAGPDNVAARVRADEVDGYGGQATWVQNRPQDPPAVPEPPAPQRRTVGPRRQLGRYTVDGRERVIWGQRVDGVVHFQPEETVVLDARRASSEDSECRPCGAGEQEERADAARPKRPNDDAVDEVPAELGFERRGRIGPRVELGRYVISEGERALCGQRVWGRGEGH